jgi:hypothetical protein
LTPTQALNIRVSIQMVLFKVSKDITDWVIGVVTRISTKILYAFSTMNFNNT